MESKRGRADQMWLYGAARVLFNIEAGGERERAEKAEVERGEREG